MILKGIRVVDTTRWAFGPFAATCLADMGAEVIKVEDPVSGDGTRYVHKTRDIPMGTSNPLVDLLNRGKKGFAVALDKPKGREVFSRLIKTTDVFMTAQRPHSLKKLGIDYETLREINPRLIYAVCGAFGEKGPQSDKPAWDGSAFARSGLMHIMQDKNTPPPVPPQGMGDLVASVTMAYGIMLALFNRGRTGQGQKVDVSLLGTMVTIMEALCMQITLATGRDFPQFDSSNPTNPLNHTYKTKDGRWLLLNMHHTDPFWHVFCETVGITELEHDKRFSGHEALCDHSHEVVAILQEVFSRKELSEWVIILGKTDMVWAPVQTLQEAYNDPQILENEFVVPYNHPNHGLGKTIGLPIKLSGVTPQIDYRSPQLGQHTEEILLQLGYSWEDIESLKNENVIP
jgi:crotonobetainyl-CoA:carnitine CoA-transferase CaiB-like acyl-CoA transferase